MRSYVALILIFLFGGQTCFADTELFRAEYSGRHSGLNISLERVLVHNEGQSYRLKSKAKNFLGSITETSDFLRTDDNFLPLRHTYLRKILGKKSQQVLSYNWENLKAHYTRSDKPERNTDHEIFVGILDPSLYQLKLQQELFSGEEALRFHFVKQRRLKLMEFELVGNTTYTMDNETYDAIEVQRINQPDERKTNIILIPELDYQIAQIRHIEKDGAKYFLSLNKFSSNKELLSSFYRHQK